MRLQQIQRFFNRIVQEQFLYSENLFLPLQKTAAFGNQQVNLHCTHWHCLYIYMNEL